MSTITLKQINTLLHHINNIEGNPTQGWHLPESGGWVANVGTLVLYSAYGKVGVSRIKTKSGAVDTVIHLGTKRDTYNALSLYREKLLEDVVTALSEGRA